MCALTADYCYISSLQGSCQSLNRALIEPSYTVYKCVLLPQITVTSVAFKALARALTEPQ